MQARYETLAPKILVGQQRTMSLAKNSTGALFSSFMPRRKEIVNLKDQFVYDLRVYPPAYFSAFSPANTFVKWALVEVDEVLELPAGMEVFHLVGGEYAVFRSADGKTDPNIFQYIFGQWMPNSKYALDDRPHFERLDPKGIKNNPEPDEEYWIPIKSKDDGA